MTKVAMKSRIDRVVFNEVVEEFKDVIDDYGRETFGLRAVVLDRGTNYRLDGTSLRVVIELSVDTKETKGKIIDRKVSDWHKYAKSFGLDPSWLGKTVNVNGSPHKIIGLRPSAKKNCVLIESRRGTEYIYPYWNTIQQLGTAKQKKEAGPNPRMRQHWL